MGIPELCICRRDIGSHLQPVPGRHVLEWFRSGSNSLYLLDYANAMTFNFHDICLFSLRHHYLLVYRWMLNVGACR
jgi:hypothetical protein